MGSIGDYFSVETMGYWILIAIAISAVGYLWSTDSVVAKSIVSSVAIIWSFGSLLDGVLIRLQNRLISLQNKQIEMLKLDNEELCRKVNDQ